MAGCPAAIAGLAMQWCSPPRRQHSGTETGSNAGAAVASNGQHSAATAIAILSFIRRIRFRGCLRRYCKS